MESKKVNRYKYFREVKEELIRESENKCGYCGSKLGITDQGNIDHYYPKSKFPELEFEKSNLVLACNYCNRMKSDRIPVDENNKKIILHPQQDDFSLHISEDANGSLIGITDLGTSTINTLQLNRKALVEDRINRAMLNVMSDKDYNSLEPILNSESSPYEKFKESIKFVEKLLNIQIEDEAVKRHHHKLLYANIITVMETYLSDSFINKTIVSQRLLRRFVESFHDYKNIKFDYADIFEKYENVETYVTKSLLDIMYHNIGKVKGMYKDTLEIDFPQDLNKVYKAVSIRHDIVHRNGKDKNKKEHNIEANEIKELIDDITCFIDNVEDQINVTIHAS